MILMAAPRKVTRKKRAIFFLLQECSQELSPKSKTVSTDMAREQTAHTSSHRLLGRMLRRPSSSEGVLGDISKASRSRLHLRNDNIKNCVFYK